MYTVKVRSQFSGAHNLREYKGKCEDLHGHIWIIELAVCSDRLDKAGMVVDFKKLKDMLNEVISELDHKYLNDVVYFKDNNPTSEKIAQYVYRKIRDKDPELDIKEITVWETDSSSATYSER